MAGSFNRGTPSYLHGLLPADFNGNPPFSMAAWIYPTNVAADQTILAIADNASDNNYHSIYLKGSTAGDPVSARSQAAAGGAEAVTGTGVTINTWHHVLGVFAASNDRRVYIDGGSKGTNATTRSPAGLDTICVGGIYDLTPSDFYSGGIEWGAIWNTALSDADAVELFRGASPKRVRPNTLVWCGPLTRGALTRELRGGVNLTNVGSVADSTLISPCRRRPVQPPAPRRFLAPLSASGWRLTDSMLLQSKALNSQLIK